MIQYLELLEKTLKEGMPHHGEKPEGAVSIFGAQVKYDLQKGFPLLTSRDMTESWHKLIVPELLWILSGSTSAYDLRDKYGSRLWLRWAKDSEKKLGTPPGEIGKSYGYQLRHWNGHTDQLREITDMLKRTPDTRRAMISLWNLDDVEIGGVKKINVANCVSSLHFERRNYRIDLDEYEPRLDLIITHRSADIPAGVSHDVAVYGLLLMLVAKEVNMKSGSLIDDVHDGQIYEIQKDKVREHLTRKTHPLPRVEITAASIFDELAPDNFLLHNYQHEDPIIYPVVD